MKAPPPEDDPKKGQIFTLWNIPEDIGIIWDKIIASEKRPKRLRKRVRFLILPPKVKG